MASDPRRRRLTFLLAVVVLAGGISAGLSAAGTLGPQVAGVLAGAAFLAAAVFQLMVPLPPVPPVRPGVDRHFAGRYVNPQRRAVESWRLFSFERDIRVSDIYVEQVLQPIEADQPLGPTLRVAHAPPVLDAQVLGRLKANVTEEEQVCIVVGQAGSGKTTLLRRWTLDLVKELESAPNLPPIPLFLSLRHIPPVAETPGDINAALVACLARTTPGLGEDLARRPFERSSELLQEAIGGSGSARRRWFRRDREPSTRPPEWIFLLDGWDEMRPEARPSVLNWITGLPPLVRVVLTTRPHMLQAPRSKQYEVREFTDDQIDTFIEKWFRAADKQRLGAELAGRIHQNTKLRALAVIPLLLTCLSIYVEVQGRVEFDEDLTKGDLLHLVAEIVLDGWDAAKESRPVDRDRVGMGMELFTELALNYPYASAIPREELVVRATEHGFERDAARSFVDHLASARWLLVPSPEGGYWFGHQVLFDFFFARGARRLVDPG